MTAVGGGDWRAALCGAVQRTLAATRAPPLLVADKDGTLTDPRKPLEPDVAGAMLGLLSAGVVMAVVSGGELHRLKAEVFDPLAAAATDRSVLEALYIVSENGARTSRYSAVAGGFESIDRVDLKERLGEARFRTVLEIVSDLMEREGIERVPAWRQLTSDGSQITFSPLGNVRDDALRAAFDPTGAKRARWADDLRRRLGEAGIADAQGLLVDIAVAGTASINILPRGINKGYAIARLIRRCGRAGGDAIYFGDKFDASGNDAEAVPHVGLAVNVGSLKRLPASLAAVLACPVDGPAGMTICLETIARALRDFGVGRGAA